MFNQGLDLRISSTHWSSIASFESDKNIFPAGTTLLDTQPDALCITTLVASSDINLCLCLEKACGGFVERFPISQMSFYYRFHNFLKHRHRRDILYLVLRLH